MFLRNLCACDLNCGHCLALQVKCTVSTLIYNKSRQRRKDSTPRNICWNLAPPRGPYALWSCLPFMGDCPSSPGLVLLKHFIPVDSCWSINESQRERKRIKWNVFKMSTPNQHSTCFMLFKQKLLIINKSKCHRQRLLAQFIDSNFTMSCFDIQLNSDWEM